MRSSRTKGKTTGKESGSISGTSSRAAAGSVSEETENCPDCKQEVTDDECGLMCELCECWFHSKCQGMSEEAYKYVSKERVHWFCSACDKRFVGIMKTVSQLAKKQELMQVELDTVKKTLDEVKGNVEKVTKFARETDVKVETMIEAKLVESVEELKKVRDITVNENPGLKREDIQEEIEKEKRKLNLVVMGLKESDDDRNELESVVAALNVSTGSRAINKVERIGRHVPGKTRPLRVVMLNTDSKAEILKACPSLKKHSEFKDVFIVPDLTRKQQEVDKKLRDKLKELRQAGETNIKITRGKIVKKLDRGEEIILFPTQA